MTTAVVLIVLGVFSRLLPHPPNAVALGAIALYAGSRLPRRWAFVVPMAVLVLTDFLIDSGLVSVRMLFSDGRALTHADAGVTLKGWTELLTAARFVRYATFLLIVLLGQATRDARFVYRPLMSLAASSLFFATSNFGEWVWSGMYPHTAAGLTACYAMAIPFVWNTVAADLVGTVSLFGLDALIAWSTWRFRIGSAARAGAKPALTGPAPAVD